MYRSLLLRGLAAVALLASLFAPVVGARAERKAARPASEASMPDTARVPANCGPLPGQPPDQPPVLRSGVALNFWNDLLDAPDDGTVEVCVLVDSTGTVREAAVSRSAAPFDSAALDAVRWWVFEPARRAGRAVPARVAVKVEARVPRDADPLVPDVVAMAFDAEARGSLSEALDAWTGALARVGVHPAFQNEWAIRQHIVRLAARLPQAPAPGPMESRARGTHNLMLRNISRGANAEYAQEFDEVLRVAPWYADAYRWRASARAASGQRDGAVRDALFFRLAAPDSASRALAERALVALAAADTLAALTILKY